jgi:hypothetical protein
MWQRRGGAWPHPTFQHVKVWVSVQISSKSVQQPKVNWNPITNPCVHNVTCLNIGRAQICEVSPSHRWVRSVRFQVLVTVNMKITVFRRVIPCSLVEAYQRFGKEPNLFLLKNIYSRICFSTSMFCPSYIEATACHWSARSPVSFPPHLISMLYLSYTA